MDLRDQSTLQAECFEEQKRGSPDGEAGFRIGNCNTKAQIVLPSAYHCCPNGQTSKKSHE